MPRWALLACIGAGALVAALGGCDVERARARRALTSGDPAVRAHALKSLAAARDRSALPRAAAMLRDRSARVRRAALAAVGALGPGEHLPAVVDLLRDTDLQVRLAAARVLGHSKRAGARRALLPVLRDRSMIVRRAARAALAAHGLPPAHQVAALAKSALREQLRRLRAGQPAARVAAARALERMARPSSRAPLLAALVDGDPMVAHAVARALAVVADEAARRRLRGLASAKDDRAKLRAAAAALSRLPRPSAADLDVLARLVDPARPAVLRAALEGLLSRGCGPLAGRSGTSGRSKAKQAKSAKTVRAARQSLARAVCAASLARERGPSTRALAVAARCALSCDEQVASWRKLLTGSESASAGKALSSAGVGEGGVTARAAVALALLGSAADVARVAERLLRWLEAQRAMSRRWVSRSAWRRLDRGDAAGTGTGAGRGAGTGTGSRGAGRAVAGKRPPASASRRRKLSWLLARYPERRPGNDGEDPLLPPAIDGAALLRVIDALGGRAAALPVLSRLAVDAKAGVAVRAAAWRALSRQKRGAAAALFGEARARLAVASPARLRRAVMSACPGLGAKAARWARGYLADKDFDVRAAAARCLGVVRDRNSVPALLGALSRERQAAVIEALGAIRARAATKPLLALLREDHPVARRDERLLVVRALGAIGDPAAAAALTRELGHPDAMTRLAAAAALRRLPSSAAIAAALRACNGDSDAAVRRVCYGR